MSRLKAAVIGVGYLGKFHAEKFAALPQVDLVGVVDSDPIRAEEIGSRLAVPGFSRLEDVIGAIDVAAIVVPSELHYTVARKCLAAGVHVLVEKPFTKTLEEADELIRMARERDLVLQIGHLERFNPALLSLRETLKEPLFIESHRLSPFPARGTDVNVVLDLMIHDIDIILNMVSSEICDIRAMGFPVLTDHIDIANARLEFASGCIANVTASRVSREPLRKLRVFQSDAYISIDYLDQEISIARKDAAGAGQAQIRLEQHRFEKADALMLEITAFVAAVQSGASPAVTGEDGRRALQVALAVEDRVRHSQLFRTGLAP